MAKKVAIIIPAYNAESSLSKTIKSVLAQTYANIEVWITNDGSKDETGRIADEWAKKDSRVKVLHQENCGCYQARLHALQKIDAPYFAFADADDTIESTMIEKMVDMMERENLDCVQCNADVTRVIEGEELLKYKFDYLVDSREACFVWNKLYRNLYDFNSFEPTDKCTNFEDLIFNLQFFKKIYRMGFLTDKFYNYEYVPSSAVHSFGPRQRHDALWMFRHHLSMAKELMCGTVSNFAIVVAHYKWLVRNIKNDAICLVRSWMKR